MPGTGKPASLVIAPSVLICSYPQRAYQQAVAMMASMATTASLSEIANLFPDRGAVPTLTPMSDLSNLHLKHALGAPARREAGHALGLV